jgi:hypothetical protein
VPLAFFLPPGPRLRLGNLGSPFRGALSIFRFRRESSPKLWPRRSPLAHCLTLRR